MKNKNNELQTVNPPLPPLTNDNQSFVRQSLVKGGSLNFVPSLYKGRLGWVNCTKAFTLAEILITLGIIGVVAAITIPSIIQSRTEKATVIKLKKTYSTIQNAFDMAIAEHGPVSNWLSKSKFDGSSTSLSCHEVWDKIIPYMPVIVKDCTGKSNSKCFASSYIRFDTKESYYSEIEYSTGCKATFTNGVSIGITAIPWYYGLFKDKVMTSITVDLNGSAKPNMGSVDHFLFYITDKGIIPAGDGYKFTQGTWPEGITTWTQPASRTAWVLYHENMDYLHCADKLSWNGAHSCKEAK